MYAFDYGSTTNIVNKTEQQYITDTLTRYDIVND